VQVLDVDFSRERISLSLKATQQDPWQEFAEGHQVGQLVYGRVTKLVQFGAFVQVGDGIEGLVHISEMSAHHVDSPEQVVTPGEELWVKIIDLDLARRRISLSIKQAAEGGELAEEYREHFEVDEHGNWTSGNPDEVEAAWAEYQSSETPDAADATAAADTAPAAEATAATEAPDVPAEEPDAVAEDAPADEPEAATEVSTAEEPEVVADAGAEEPDAVDAPVAADDPDA
jgi:small subunit ribosomal protein S1